MMHGSGMWASQTLRTISRPPTRMRICFVPSMLARSPVTVLIWTGVGVHTAESTPLVTDEGDLGPSVHQSSARLTIQLAVHKEPSGLAKAAHQGSAALEGLWGRMQVFQMAARGEAEARVLDSPRQGDQARHTDDSRW